jgi:ubiquinone/menaquinone biosynthesis C-methylase UbiE
VWLVYEVGVVTMTYFSYQTAAARYAQGRPYFHPLVMEKIKTTLGLHALVARALDVVCGAGQSTLALTALADEVVGADSSRAMLAAAPVAVSVRYVAARAEQLPFAGHTFDLLTAASALHWFDRAAFLAEAGRILRPGSWLAPYENGFSGRMLEDPVFERWIRETYAMRYPQPSRNCGPLTTEEAERAGFRIMQQERYTNEVVFSVEELVRYLLTQSNVIAVVETGAEAIDTVERWWSSSVALFFPQPRCTFLFGGSITYLQREAE